MTDDRTDQDELGVWERDFREHMAALRGAMDMTQTDLARVLRDRHGLRFHQQIVARIEAGERPLRLNEAQLIAQTLGTDLATMMSDPGTVESARLKARLAQQQLATSTAEVTVFLDDGIEEFERLCKELESAWAAHASAQKDLGSTIDDKLVHKGLAFTLHEFETRFAGAREKLASVIELSEV